MMFHSDEELVDFIAQQREQHQRVHDVRDAVHNEQYDLTFRSNLDEVRDYCIEYDSGMQLPADKLAALSLFIQSYTGKIMLEFSLSHPPAAYISAALNLGFALGYEYHKRYGEIDGWESSSN